MVNVPYRIIERIAGKFADEIPESSHSNLERFEAAKKRYTELTEEFDTRAGHYENCRIILKAFGQVEDVVYGIESMVEDSSIFNVTRGEARERMKKYILSSYTFTVKINELQNKLDRVETLLSDLIYEEARPVLPVFDQVRSICDINDTIRNQLENREIMEEERKRIIDEAVKNAGITLDAVKYLTTNEIMLKLLLVSQPRKAI